MLKCLVRDGTEGNWFPIRKKKKEGNQNSTSSENDFFSGKRKLKEFMASTPALVGILMSALQAKGKPQQIHRKRQEHENGK